MNARQITAPVLAYPELNLSYMLHTDASDVGADAVSSQVQDSAEMVIAYYSKTLKLSEKKLLCHR